MPFVSEAQKGYLYAKHPDIAAKFQKHTPKGQKLPERMSKKDKASKKKDHGKKAAFLEGYYQELVKQSDMGPTLRRLSQLLEDNMRKAQGAGSERISTMAKAPRLLPPMQDARTVTRMQMEILQDPTIPKVEKAMLMARLTGRAPQGGPAAGRLLLGEGLPGGIQNALGLSLAAKGSPSMSNFLQRILNLGLSAAKKLTATDYQITDRRRSPEQERHSQWKIRPI